jgi:hypothetical protein
MDTSATDLNTKLFVVYYNGENPHMFRVHNDITLFELKDMLYQINHQLNHRDTRRVDNVDYRRPSTDSAGRVQFNQMKFKNDDDVRLCSRYLVSMVLKDQSIWTLHWSDISKMFGKV